jgi:hypothetical protein
MAGSTICGKQSGVGNGFEVTGSALGRCSFELTVDMTCRAADLGVHSVQKKAGCVMIEIRHSVCAIMTGYTIISKIQDMVCNEDWIFAGMACFACLGDEFKTMINMMAARAVQWHHIIVELMPLQTKTCQRVVEKTEGSHGWVEVPAAVIRMTIPALFNFRDYEVGTRLFLNLRVDPSVTLEA